MLAGSESPRSCARRAGWSNKHTAQRSKANDKCAGLYLKILEFFISIDRETLTQQPCNSPAMPLLETYLNPILAPTMPLKSVLTLRTFALTLAPLSLLLFTTLSRAQQADTTATIEVRAERQEIAHRTRSRNSRASLHSCPQSPNHRRWFSLVEMGIHQCLHRRRRG